MTVTTDFSHETIASLLEALRRMAADGLPTESQLATNIKRELLQRGVPLALTESLTQLARDVERAGARVSFGEEPRKVQITIRYGLE